MHSRGPGSPTCCLECSWFKILGRVSDQKVLGHVQGRLQEWLRPPNSSVRNPKDNTTGQLLNRQKRMASDVYSITFILWLFLNLCRQEQNNLKHSFCPPSQLWLPCPSAVPWELPLLNLHLLPSCISIGRTKTLALRVSYCSRVFNCNRKLLRMKKLLWQEVWAVWWKQSRLGTRTVLNMNFNSDLQ